MLSALRIAEDRLAVGDAALRRVIGVDAIGAGAVGPGTVGAAGAGGCAGRTANAAAAAADAATMLARAAMAGTRLRTGMFLLQHRRTGRGLSGEPSTALFGNGDPVPVTPVERRSSGAAIQITNAFLKRTWRR